MKFYTHELPTSLDGLIDLAIRVDARLQSRGQRALQMPVVNTDDRFSSMGTVGHVFDSEPMQVGRAHLSREEKERTQESGTMFILRCGWSYCGAVPGKSQSPPVDRRLLTGGVIFEKSSSLLLLFFLFNYLWIVLHLHVKP